MTTREELDQQIALHEAAVRVSEARQARLSFRDFLRYVSIEDTQGGGVVPFVMWPHLSEVVDLLRLHKLLVWLKARQIGATWLLAAYCVWTAMYKLSALVILLSQGELEARELLRRCRVVHRLLPAHIAVEAVEPASGERMEWEDGGRILALPSTEKAGQSFTATLVVIDEADFHAWFETNLAAVKPTIDQGGQLVVVSTADLKTVDSPFKRLYRAAPGNGWKRLFFGWRARPGRDDAWYAKVRAQATDLALFEKHYPFTPEEALAAPQAMRFFDTVALDAMRTELRKPIIPGGPVSVWQQRIVGRAYCAFTDTAHGVGGDYFVTCVMDAETGAIVADVFSNVIPPEEGADLSVKLLKAYGSPLWGVEDNEWGILTLKTAVALGYDNLYHRENDDEKPAGWHTDAKTRPLLWGQLQEAIRARYIHVWNEAGLAQFYDVVRNPLKDGGRIEAIAGGHDDYPFAVGGCWQLRQHARRDSARSVAVKGRW